MANDPRWSNASKRKKDRRYWEGLQLPCAICGGEIDYTLPFYYTDEQGRQRVNPDAFVIDEIVPVARGGNPYDRTNQQPAHQRCNQAKSDKLPGEDMQPRLGRIECLYPW